jgi:SAM-dependent methyltransferase
MQSTTPALTRERIQSSCRWLDAERHPLLHRLSRDDIYDGGNGMAPGGLLLAEMLADQLSLRPGGKILDLGCGRGQSSVFLASQYDVEVTSVDLWIGVEERKSRAADAGMDDAITAVQGDVQRGLPIERESLDAIFCMQAFHCFGAQRWVLRYLTSLLKPGGRIGITQGCFRDEVEVLPSVFTDTAGWSAEYHKYHSPRWWRHYFASQDELEVVLAQEVIDGDVMWEDDVLYRGERAGWSASYIAHSAWLIRHILHGRAAAPSLTHCMVVASKGNRAAETSESRP